MTAAIDPRRLRVTVTIGDKATAYEGFAMVCSGTKCANASENSAEVRILDLAQETRDRLLTECSPFNSNKQRKRMRIEAGRVSTGLSLIFEGDIVTSAAGQPPDPAISLKSQTGAHDRCQTVSRCIKACSHRGLAEQIADEMGLSLDYSATDKRISNYSHAGDRLTEVAKLGKAGGVRAYVDDGHLVVTDTDAARPGQARVLDVDSGLVGIPEWTEHGVKVRYLVDSTSRLGGQLILRSKLNPAVNGAWRIAKLGFELASRDTPWYYLAECTRL